MIHVILHGCNGKMGKVIQALIDQDPEVQVVAGIDKNIDAFTPFKLYFSAKECEHKADVVIDFSHHSAIEELIDFCTSSLTPVVIATTALSEENKQLLAEAAKTIPVFHSANMSLGINILTKIIKSITPALESDFNVEIIEKHHNKKVDSPSGTALLLADSVNNVCQNKKDYLYGRHSKADECKITDLAIHAVRGGTIAGEHTVLYAGPDEVIEITHTALSRNIFANGALKAAKFLAGQKKGLYTMGDLV